MIGLVRQVSLLLLLIMGLVAMGLQPVGLAQAQQAAEGQENSGEAEAKGEAEAQADGDAAAQSDSDADVDVDEAPPEDAYTEEELDDLVAPVALYPDSLLAQVLVAATYPLDVVKAQRWADENSDLDGNKRANAVAEEGWDPSITVLAAGFPTVLKRMADDLDWTEQLGEAMLVQDSDILDAVQRQRARAAAAGNLESNEAQNVEVQDDQISVVPADPNVVYVPAYDAQTVYTQPVSSTTVEKEDDTKYTGGELALTGVMAFGAGMIVNEIFNDDDDWGGYWRGPPPVRWNDGGFYPRPGGVNVGGDVNINVDKNNNLGNRGNGWKPDQRQRDKAKRDIQQRNSKVANRKVGNGSGKLSRPGGASVRTQTASLENRMQKRDGGGASAKAKRPQAKPSANAFTGSKRSGTETRKALNRGKVSSNRAAAGKARNAKPKTKAAPKRRTDAGKHKRKSAGQNSSRGRQKAAHGGGRRGNR